MKRVRIVISGRVQGVWFRGWTEDQARRLRLDGWVRNRRGGTVEALFQGEDAVVDDMVELCRRGPPYAQVHEVEIHNEDEPVRRGFKVVPNA